MITVFKSFIRLKDDSPSLFVLVPKLKYKKFTKKKLTAIVIKKSRDFNIFILFEFVVNTFHLEIKKLFK